MREIGEALMNIGIVMFLGLFWVGGIAATWYFPPLGVLLIPALLMFTGLCISSWSD